MIINRQFIATTKDGGDSRQLVNSTNIPTFQNNESTIISSGNNSYQAYGDYVWFGTSKGRIYSSKDKGKTWKAYNTSLGSSANITSVAFRDTLHGIALNGDAIYTQFCQTEDGGISWSNITPNPSISIANIKSVPFTDRILVGTSDLSTPLFGRVSAFSTDFGLNWQIIDSGIAFGCTDFISPKIGWISRARITSPIHPALYKWDSDVFVNSKDLRKQNKIELFPNQPRRTL